MAYASLESDKTESENKLRAKIQQLQNEKQTLIPALSPTISEEIKQIVMSFKM